MASFLFLHCSLCLILCSASANITKTQPLRDPETLISSNMNYKFGFFSPKNSANRYAGIWYNIQESDSKEVIWIANRDTPLNDTSGLLEISNGNLQLSNGQNNILWSSNVSNQSDSSVAQLLDTGNLVLLSNATRSIIWQSFDHQTDTLVPPVTTTIHENERNRTILRSWKNPSDPVSGRFALSIYRRSLTEVFTWDGDKPHWRSGPWNGNILLGVSFLSLLSLNGFSVLDDNHENTFHITYTVTNGSFSEHIVLSYDGDLHTKNWDKSNQKWTILGHFPENDCDIYGKCGPFGSCNPERSPICDCLKGFEPKYIDEWNKGDWNGGCVRRKQLQCNSTGEKADGFFRLEHMKVPDNAESSLTRNQDECGRSCLEECSCVAYAFHSAIGCMTWNGSLIDIQHYSDHGVELFIRLPHSELGKTNKWKLVIPITVIFGMFLIGTFTYLVRKRLLQENGKESMSRRTLFRNMFEDSGNQLDNQDLPLFEFLELSAATNNFEQRNKLGQGGFGPVYKGKLKEGQEIAVKRLSRASGQGVQEFINEVIMISKLQHRNLVKLLGCCVEGEEKLLVYELMPNKSLDALLFDPCHQEVLNWKTRFNIIKGICRGVLYLHKDSRLRIIHRDLKTSNILLDEELSPKISDFGMARIFGDKQDQAETLRVVGTYGYMSPEYAMEGRFSEKSDIFSLGVIFLEIVRGRRNGGLLDDESLSFLGYAWQLWNEDNVLSLIDSTISNDPCFQMEISRSIQVALLCVQDEPEDRPSISTVISMLDNEVKDLPHPLKPGFTHRRVCSTSEVPQDSQQYNSVNLVTISSISFR